MKTPLQRAQDRYNKAKAELDQIADVKQCTRCHQYQAKINFYSRAASEDGLSPACKTCQGEYTKMWREKNADYVALKRQADREKKKEIKG